MNTTVNDRVRKHRAKLHEQQRHRLEISIDIPLLKDVQKIASHTNQRLCSVIQDALRSHVEDYQNLTENSSWLVHERARLQAQPANAPLLREQIDQYNRRRVDYNTQRSRFFKDSASV